MKRSLYLLALLLTFTVFMHKTVHADTESENAALSRMVSVLDSLTPIINEAQRQQDKSTRVQFQYDHLRSDINQIKAGIEQKLNPATQTLEPRKVIPLSGDYLTLQHKQP